jgi:GNAT superfamily N-acetyltransferase
MPSMAREEINEINKAVGQRWRGIDPLLPEPGDLPEGCQPPLVAAGKEGKDGRPAGMGICHHQYVPADSLAQTWSTATRFGLTMRLGEPDTLAAADDLLGQWRDHLARLPKPATDTMAADDTAAVVTWPARDVSGVRALLRHGLQPFAVIAVRPAGRPAPAHNAHKEHKEHNAHKEIPDLLIRQAEPGDLDAVTELDMGVIGYDAYFGGSIPRPATPALVRAGARTELQKRPEWTWLALRRGRPVGLAVVEPPDQATWIAGMTRPGATAYLQSMFVRPDERGAGTGAALVAHVHDALDARGIDLTLLHYAQVNPLSAPFWHRMGYRPLWTVWEARPASALR